MSAIVTSPDRGWERCRGSLVAGRVDSGVRGATEVVPRTLEAPINPPGRQTIWDPASRYQAGRTTP